MDAIVRTLSQKWWLVWLQGVLSVVLGMLALVWPGITLGVVLVLWGLFTLLNGLGDVFAAIGAVGSHQSWGRRLAAGLVGILAGSVILRWPGVSALFALYVVAIWAMVTGIEGIIRALADHAVITQAGLVALAGTISVLFGIAMFAWPAAGLLTLVYLVGSYAIVYGLIACVIAFRVHSLRGHIAGSLVPPGPTPTF